MASSYRASECLGHIGSGGWLVVQTAPVAWVRFQKHAFLLLEHNLVVTFVLSCKSGGANFMNQSWSKFPPEVGRNLSARM